MIPPAVRFGVADDSAHVLCWLAGPTCSFGAEVTSGPSFGYPGVRTVFRSVANIKIDKNDQQAIMTAPRHVLARRFGSQLVRP